jgi:hypothetical protein
VTQADSAAALVTSRLPDRFLSTNVTVPNDQPYVGFTVESHGQNTYQLSPEAFDTFKPSARRSE